jgi:hypothetical protein
MRPDASNPTISRQQPRSGQLRDIETPQAYKDWQNIIDFLIKTSQKLKKEEETHQNTPIGPLIKLFTAEIQRAREARDHVLQQPLQEPTLGLGLGQSQGQLNRIEAKITAVQQDLATQIKRAPIQGSPPTQGPKTWANIVSQQAKEIQTAKVATLPISTTIRLRPEEDLKGLPPKDLLDKA